MLRIYGASDDLVEVEGIQKGEIGCWDRRVDFEIGTVDGGGYKIGTWHTSEGGWQVQLSLLAREDDVAIPWPARFELSERGYSIAVVIDCPAGTPVVARLAGKVVEIR